MYDLAQSYGYQYTLYSGLQPCKKQGCGVSQPWIYCTGPNIRKRLQKSTLLAILAEWPKHQPYPLSVPMSSNAISTQRCLENQNGMQPKLSFISQSCNSTSCVQCSCQGGSLLWQMDRWSQLGTPWLHTVSASFLFVSHYIKYHAFLMPPCIQINVAEVCRTGNF